jgi:hypothetical protein
VRLRLRPVRRLRASWAAVHDRADDRVHHDQRELLRAYFRKYRDEFNVWSHLVIPIFGTIAMLAPLAAALIPDIVFGPENANVYPVTLGLPITIIWFVLGLAMYAWLRATRPRELDVMADEMATVELVGEEADPRGRATATAPSAISSKNFRSDAVGTLPVQMPLEFAVEICRTPPAGAHGRCRWKTTSWVPGMARARYSLWRMSYILGSVPKNTPVGKSTRGRPFPCAWPRPNCSTWFHSTSAPSDQPTIRHGSVATACTKACTPRAYWSIVCPAGVCLMHRGRRNQAPTRASGVTAPEPADRTSSGCWTNRAGNGIVCPLLRRRMRVGCHLEGESSMMASVRLSMSGSSRSDVNLGVGGVGPDQLVEAELYDVDERNLGSHDPFRR